MNPQPNRGKMYLASNEVGDNSISQYLLLKLHYRDLRDGGMHHSDTVMPQIEFSAQIARGQIEFHIFTASQEKIVGSVTNGARFCQLLLEAGLVWWRFPHFCYMAITTTTVWRSLL